MTELDECPNGRHDDIVDTFGYAERIRLERFVPPGTGAREAAESAPAADPYVGVFGSGVDYARQQW